MLTPRFALLTAAGGRRETLLRPAALAPEPSGGGGVGEVSGPAEAFGVRPGMRLGEALARCPELLLVNPDTQRTEDAWERLLRRLEGIGAQVESRRSGEAFFEASALRHLCGGHVEGVLRRARRAIQTPARSAAAPGRFCSYAAATHARARAHPIVPAAAARRFLAPLPVTLLRGAPDLHDPGAGDAGGEAGGMREAASFGDARRAAAVELVDALQRLGIRTLGELAALPRDAMADRFGAAGLRALELAAGQDTPLRPRRPPEAITEWLELPESAPGSQLERAVSLLTGRLLTRPERRGRTLRLLRLLARLDTGGGWRAEVALREPTADAERIQLALLPKLHAVPGPVLRLGLQAVVLGATAHRQAALLGDAADRRHGRLAEAIRQARAVAGRDAVLRVLDVDPRSRVPERRAMLAPFPDPGRD